MSAFFKSSKGFTCVVISGNLPELNAQQTSDHQPMQLVALGLWEVKGSLQHLRRRAWLHCGDFDNFL